MNIKNWVGKFADPDVKQRPHPFWSWNDRLDPAELRRQVREMRETGHGGFFMHARDGLLTPYMGEDWFECVRAAADEAEKCGVMAWCYDEDGWPSGSAGRKIPREYEEYRVSWVRLVDEEKDPDKARSGIFIGRYAVSPDGTYRKLRDGDGPARDEGEREYWAVSFSDESYTDILNPEAVRKFLDLTHERYLDETGTMFADGALSGFFTDEPQYSLCKTPWSPVFEDEFREQNGYRISDHVPALFFDSPGCESVRHDFWSMVNRLYVESFGKQIYDWCSDHLCRLTGHGMMEDNMLCQMHCTAGVMPLYEYMHVPGIDWLGRDPQREKITGRTCLPVTPLQLGSVAAQLGKEGALTETFALSGWDVTFSDLKWLVDWQFMYGVTLLCQHLEGYTIRGFRKNDYPPCMFYQSPWWRDYRIFNDTVARTGAILGSGAWDPDVLVIHPMHSLWIRFNGTDINSEQAYDDRFNLTVLALADMHVDFHFGDETVMRRHGSAEDGILTVGTAGYRTVILPGLTGLDRSTFELLTAFTESGGRLIVTGREPEFIDGRQAKEELAPLLDAAEKIDLSSEDARAYLEKNGLIRASLNGGGDEKYIHLTSRYYPDEDRRIYFLLNTERDRSFEIEFTADGEYMSEIRPDGPSVVSVPHECGDGKVTARLRFEPQQSRMIAVEYSSAERDDETDVRPVTDVTFGDVWDVAPGGDPNCMMLEYCTVATPDGDETEPIHIYNAGNKIFSLDDPSAAEARFGFTVSDGADPCKFGDFRIVTEQRPSATVKLNGQLLRPAEGEWWLDRSFTVYHAGDLVRHGENVISVSGLKSPEDDELGLVYLTGDFGVFSVGEFAKHPKDGLTAEGPFFLGNRKTAVRGDDLVTQGYPFFRGYITLEQNVRLRADGTRYRVRVPKPKAALCRVKVNGEVAATLPWADFECEITDLVREGENRIGIELCVGNRNLLGPHHLKEVVPYSVGPGDFYPYSPSTWQKRYAFVSAGLGDARR